MSDIFGVDIAGVVLDAFTGNLMPVTLHKVASTTSDYGAPIKTAGNYGGEGVRGKWRTEVAAAKGYPIGTVKLIVLQTPGMPHPTTDDEVTIMGQRHRIVDVEKDPVDATWVLAGVPTTS
jgi:hypothetical protein